MIPSPICAAAPIELAFSAIQVAKVLPTGIVVVPKSTASKVSRFSPSVKDANVFVLPESMNFTYNVILPLSDSLCEMTCRT